jgi:uncharacterized protein YbjT (DUF2867 family)
MVDAVHVIGASGRSGLALCRSLLADGVAVVAVVRDPAKWAAAGLAGEVRRADLGDPAALRAALAGAVRVVSCAHARHAAAIIAAAPEAAMLVLLGRRGSSRDGRMRMGTVFWPARRLCWGLAGRG